MAVKILMSQLTIMGGERYNFNFSTEYAACFSTIYSLYIVLSYFMLHEAIYRYKMEIEFHM